MNRFRPSFSNWLRLWTTACLLGWLGFGAAPRASAADPLLVTNLVRKDFWDANGSINAIVEANGIVYVGGSFSYVGPKGRKVAALDLYTGEAQMEFPRIFGSRIRAILDDGNGGWFIGGLFSEVGGVSRTNLAHVFGNFSVDPDFQPDPNGEVFALASDGDTLFVGGDFTTVAGTPRRHLASIRLPDFVLTTWMPEPDGRVSALLAGEDRIYAGGSFTFIGGQGAEYLAALDPQTGAAFGWFPLPDAPVLTMGLLDRRLFVGGEFNIIGGAFRENAAAVDTQTGEATPWDPHPSGGDVTTLRAACDTVYIGGSFTNVHGVVRHRVAAVDSDAGLPTSWDAGLDRLRAGNLNSSVLALELSGDAVYLSGQFNVVADPSRQDLVSVDARTGQLLPWNPGVGGGVSAISVSGRTVLAGFLSAPNGVERTNLAAFDAVTGKATDWNPGADGTVYALAVSGPTVFAGGNFANCGGQVRNRLAALNIGTGLALPGWNPTVNNTVFALAAGGNTLYLGGTFTSVGGQVRQRLAAVSTTNGAVLTTWFANTDSGVVLALALSGTTLYVGGNFNAVRGTNLVNLGALDSTTGEPRAWFPNPDDSVLSLAVAGNTVYAGGDFTSIRNQPRNHVAAIDAFSGQPTPWNPGANREVLAFAFIDNTIYISGAFGTVGGQPRLGIAALDDSGALLNWNPGTSPFNRVAALAASGKGLFAGGSGLAFQSASSEGSLVQFPKPGAPSLLIHPQDQTVAAGQSAQFQVVATGDAPLSYQWRFNGSDLPGPSAATLLLTNVQAAQSGTYEVVVSNPLGSVTAGAQLVVLVPITITAQPSDFSGAVGSSVVLNVGATGNPTPLYQWRLNGVNIPGAVFPTLPLSNLTATDGGSYQVAIANSRTGVVSRVARVVVNNAALPFADDFAARGAISGFSGVGSGNNTNATLQLNPDEPSHEGKPGGRSVWLHWTAPANGIATFNTRGSGFDTLLAVYTGSSFTNLSPVAFDEDRGGFLTSRAAFKVTNGIDYSITIDGLAGASGDIVLQWELDISTSEFPRILSQPVSQAVGLGDTANFNVLATSPTPMTFQWFFGCQPILEATNSSLTIPNVRRRDVGNYHVLVMNASALAVESLPVSLELGPQADSRSFDKLEDLLAALRLAGIGPFAPASSGLGGDPLLVGMGSIASQTFNTSSNTTSLSEASHCGVLGGHSTWLAFKPASNGTVRVDTIGSQFDTVLAIYRDTNLITLVTNPMSVLESCDNNSAPDGLRSQLSFTGRQGRVYLAVVDGINGARGIARINWALGLPPPPPTSNGSVTTYTYGSTQTLAAGAMGGIPPPTCQWRLNGTNLPGATGTNLVLANLNPWMSGTYSVVWSNAFGMTTNIRAIVTVDVPLHLETWPGRTNGAFPFRLLGNTGQVYAVQTSMDLKQWSPLHSGTLTNWLVPFLDTNATSFQRRFYRVMP